jgi:hypothetical protein
MMGDSTNYVGCDCFLFGKDFMNDQRSVYEQLLDVLKLTNHAGLYDAADCIRDHKICPNQSGEEKIQTNKVGKIEGALSKQD